MVKKIHIVVPMGLLLVSGCSWRSKKQVQPEESATIAVPEAEEERLSIFDVHEQAFVLEDSANPFTTQGEAPLAEQEPLCIADRAEQIETIYFGFNRYSIAPEHKTSLQRTTQTLREMLSPEQMIVVEGHACNSAGSPRYNTMLSEKRAKEVASYLVQAGIPQEQIRVVGRGSEMRKVPTGNREQQAPNRRVEFYIVEKNKNN